MTIYALSREFEKVPGVYVVSISEEPNTFTVRIKLAGTFDHSKVCEVAEDCRPCGFVFELWHEDGYRIQRKESLHYPHKCPRCGQRAYVGLSNVEHEGEPCEV